MDDWRDRLAGVLAVAIVLLAGGSLAAGIRNALFDTAPVRAGSFSAADVADLLVPAEDVPAVDPLPTSTTTTMPVAPPDETSTTTTTAKPAAAGTTTTTRPITVTTSAATVTSTSTTSTTVEDGSENRGRSSENRGRGKPDDD